MQAAVKKIPVPDTWQGSKGAWRLGYNDGLQGRPQRCNPYRLTRKRDVWGHMRSSNHYAWKAGQREGKKARRERKA